MVIVSNGGLLDGIQCSVHRLPPASNEAAGAGYGMRVVAFGRGTRSGPGAVKARYFEFYSLSHLFEGSAFYWTPSGGLSRFEAGSAVLVPPGFVHSYGGDRSPYVEDSLCFHGPLADSLSKAGILKPGVLKFGFERRLLPIIEMAMDPLESSQIAACVELQRLLLRLGAENAPPRSGGAKGRIEALIEDLKLAPERWWTVEEMAARCELGGVQFRRLFKEMAGMAPKRYLEELKMKRAMEMLVGSRDSVAEIGRRLSYSDPFHFSRRFKETTGLSPADYRRSILS